MKLEVPIKVDIDDVTELIHDLQCLQTYKLGVNETTVLVSLDSVVGVFADHIRAKRLGKDTNVPGKSALDHIHNVVAENEYKRGYKEGYEHGKADTAPKWIPVGERPPEEEGDYLVTDEAAGMTETMIDEYMCCDDGEWTWLYSQHAIARMPLVEPYNGDSCPTIFKGDGDK